MYRAIKNAIENTDFDLNKIIEKIDIFHIEEKLTNEERVELLNLARSKARAENSYSIQKQLDDIFERLEILENKNTQKEEPTIPVEYYPEYRQPTGAHDAYKIGDKITYKSKKYTCKMDNCVWSPEAYPQGWEEVIEKKVEVK